ncbi:hypothetical protein ZWY2020_006851 [Hordeum vulgare]|nr:hypothetical protein ZWY2020_006851 [Hordeum vulgare]
MVRRLVDTLAGDTLLCKRFWRLPTRTRKGIEALQLYSKDVSRRLLDFVKSRSAAAKAEPS